jgi:transposase InsO family protein
LADEARDAEQVMANRTAWRICRDNSWWSAFEKKRAKIGKKPGPSVHDDLCKVTDYTGRIRHAFSAEEVNALRLTDVTEYKTAEGTFYLCAIKDVFSNRIVG